MKIKSYIDSSTCEIFDGDFILTAGPKIHTQQKWHNRIALRFEENMKGRATNMGGLRHFYKLQYYIIAVSS